MCPVSCFRDRRQNRQFPQTASFAVCHVAPGEGQGRGGQALLAIARRGSPMASLEPSQSQSPATPLARAQAPNTAGSCPTPLSQTMP